jgi:hypothetical protein
MRSLFVVKLEPGIEIRLQLIDGLVELFSKRYRLELVEHGFVKPLANPDIFLG